MQNKPAARNSSIVTRSVSTGGSGRTNEKSHALKNDGEVNKQYNQERITNQNRCVRKDGEKNRYSEDTRSENRRIENIRSKAEEHSKETERKNK